MISATAVSKAHEIEEELDRHDTAAMADEAGQTVKESAQEQYRRAASAENGSVNVEGQKAGTDGSRDCFPTC